MAGLSTIGNLQDKSFYYYEQNPSGFCLLAQVNKGYCYLSLAVITKFLKIYKKNEMNCGQRANGL